MEAVPRLPMISFETKTNIEIVSFGAKLKQYISSFYHEDPESYNNEIHTLETLRAGAVRPVIDISGCQMLKKYYCQLHFLKSRFPMEDGNACSVYFSWRDNYSNMVCSVADIDFELMNILFDIGAVHSKLGALDTRVTPEGMKMACTHFQCAAWAFQSVRESYPQMVSLVLAPEVIHFMHLTCLAQAQECILEKSMMDNRKATIIAKVAVQVVDYYKQALNTLQTTEEGSLSDLLGSRTYKDWIKYLNFKTLYHKAIALLYLGQQAEEQQKMGERVSFYQAAADTLQEAIKKASHLSNQQEINEALAFTTDVIEGKKKAAKNENEFIYHEEVPDKDALPDVKGASLVKGIPFSVNDTDVSGPDIFARLIPMEAHEASSLYSEKKANLLRQLGEGVENKDKALVEFVSSLQLDGLSQMRQANGLTQDLVDRAAAMSAKPTAIQDLVSAMSKLSSIYHDVEAMLSEIDGLIKDEEHKEKIYQTEMGSRPPSIIATDLTREYTKYQEAHSKACESNQNLHKAMTTHSANLKILSLPLTELKQQIPSIEFPNPNINEDVVNEMEKLMGKIDEMKKQRAMLWAQFHDAVKNDDITSRLVTCSQISKEQLFDQELQKHQNQATLIEQNMAAQDNILKALVDAYARFTESRRYIQDVITKRTNMLAALNNSYDTYDDLLAKANKGLEFYNKLETNVSKLLQRVRSTCRVQDEEREQILAKQVKPVINTSTPKLKDYLDAKVDNKKPEQAYTVLRASTKPDKKSEKYWPPGVRPTPVGSEMNSDTVPTYVAEQANYPSQGQPAQYNPYYNSAYATANTTLPNTSLTYSNNCDYSYTEYDSHNVDQDLNNKMANLMSNKVSCMENQSYDQQDVQQYMYGYDQTKQFGSMAESNVTLYANQNVPYVPGVNMPVYSPPNTYASDKNPNMMPSDKYADSKQSPTSSNLPNTSLQQYYNQPTMTYDPSNVYAQPLPSSYVANSYTSSASVPNAQGGNYNMQYGTPSNIYIDQNAYMNSSMMTSYNMPSQQPTNTYSHKHPAPSAYNPETSTDAESGYVNSHMANHTYTDPSTQYGQYYNNYQQYTTQVTTANPFAINPVGTYQSYSVQPEQLQNYTSLPNQGSYSIPSVPIATGQINYSFATPDGISGTVQSVQPVTNNFPASEIQSPADITPTKKETSNVDLLSGLDFTINQAPLVPQPKKVETPKEIPVSKPVTQQPTPSLPKTDKMEENLREHVIRKQFRRSSFEDPVLIKDFIQEVDRFEKFVDSLSLKTLNGPTPLEIKWKHIQDKQDSEQLLHSISVARCYPMKNRYPDILPFDETRVKLQGKKHDYINASHVKHISLRTPEFIVTQSPLHNTYSEFWTMVCDEHVELIVCLINDGEIGNDKYWPVQPSPLIVENFSISIGKQHVHQHWTDTELIVNQLDIRSTKKIRHIQFRAWPSTLFPPLQVAVDFLNEILQHPKLFTYPILIHCSAGIGRSGFLCLVLCAAAEIITNPPAIPDLGKLAIKLSAARKNIIRDREHFKYAYQVLLHFLKETIQTNQLGKKIAMGDTASIHSPSTPSVTKEEDPLSLLDPFWASRRLK
ncbi:hypothetical protein RN001_007272 [Aquatica leii]|uniref:Tyrosine-protein phosphatase non-receptor type 23 n=1 Tax=Aquatica leii TaxID=1421715 RepID=A0AAN7PCV8_9COLE|nr:hypothetical protein RN001_007272 [Aquatica leii]